MKLPLRLLPPLYLTLSSPSITRTALRASSEDDWESVSDAEALLACKAYLVRKKKLAWSAASQRTKRRQQAKEDAQEDYMSRGFFWEDLQQLPSVSDYEESPTPVDEPVDSWVLVDDFGESLETENNEDSNFDTIVNSPDVARRFSLQVQEEETEEELDDFSAIDGNPSPSHIRRSQALKRRFADPKWKASWYEKRWGNRGNKQPNVLNILRKVHSLNPDQFLSSPEMVNMSQEEIRKLVMASPEKFQQQGQFVQQKQQEQ